MPADPGVSKRCRERTCSLGQVRLRTRAAIWARPSTPGLLHTLEFGEFTGAPPSNQRLPPDFSLPCSAMPPAPPGPDALFAREGQQQSKYLPFLCLIQGFKRIKVVFYDQICISLSSSVPFTVRQSPLIFSEQQRSVRTHKYKTWQVPNLRSSDSTKKHHFNLMFLDVSITLHTVDMD